MTIEYSGRKDEEVAGYLSTARQEKDKTNKQKTKKKQCVEIRKDMVEIQ